MIGSFTIFLVCFSALALVGSAVMCGWYVITRGHVDYNAEGQAIKVGKLFKGWHFFWTRTYAPRRVSVHGEALAQAVMKMQRELGFQTLAINYIATAITSAAPLMQYKLLVRSLTGYDLEKITAESDRGSGVYVLKVNVARPRFPEWLTHPLSECVYCFASVYGSALYWTSLWLVDVKTLFVWTTHPTAASLFFWVLYCVACSGLNGAWIKKVL